MRCKDAVAHGAGQPNVEIEEETFIWNWPGHGAAMKAQCCVARKMEERIDTDVWIWELEGLRDFSLYPDNESKDQTKHYAGNENGVLVILVEHLCLPALFTPAIPGVFLRTAKSIVVGVRQEVYDSVSRRNGEEYGPGSQPTSQLKVPKLSVDGIATLRIWPHRRRHSTAPLVLRNIKVEQTLSPKQSKVYLALDELERGTGWQEKVLERGVIPQKVIDKCRFWQCEARVLSQFSAFQIMYGGAAARTRCAGAS